MNFNPAILEKGLNVGFTAAMAELLKAKKLSPGIMQAVWEIPSTASQEKLGWIGTMPTVQQWLGELNAKEFENYEYIIKNLDWAAAVPVKENDMEDDQTGVLRMIPQLLAARILAHPEKLMFNLLINGEDFPAYDGISFFSDATGNRVNGNIYTGSGTINIANLKADLNGSQIAMAKVTDDEGEFLDVNADMIVCPKALEYLFLSIVKDVPDAKIFNPFAGKFKVVGDPRMDIYEPDNWYLLATGEEVKPLIFQSRSKAKNRLWKTPQTKNWVYSADYRGNGAYGIPHLAMKIKNS